jgi:hypothetical protein
MGSNRVLSHRWKADSATGAALRQRAGNFSIVYGMQLQNNLFTVRRNNEAGKIFSHLFLD